VWDDSVVIVFQFTDNANVQRTCGFCHGGVQIQAQFGSNTQVSQILQTTQQAGIQTAIASAVSGTGGKVSSRTKPDGKSGVTGAPAASPVNASAADGMYAALAGTIRTTFAIASPR
jgi:hypothetical protein